MKVQTECFLFSTFSMFHRLLLLSSASSRVHKKQAYMLHMQPHSCNHDMADIQTFTLHAQTLNSKHPSGLLEI